MLVRVSYTRALQMLFLVVLYTLLGNAIATVEEDSTFHTLLREPTKVSRKLIPDRNIFHIPKRTVKLTIADESCLYGHNVLREHRNVEKLKLDDRLTRSAQEWAITLAAANRQEQSNHNPFPEDNTYFGSNVFKGYFGNNTCQDALYTWNSNEVKFSKTVHYKYDRPFWRRSNSQFIQLFWPSAKYYGIGVATESKAEGFKIDMVKTIVVARYQAGVINEGNYTVNKPKDDAEITIKQLYPTSAEATKQLDILVPEGGGWSNWVNVTDCPKKCNEDDGKYTRRRYCIRERPENDCKGENEEQLSCKLRTCSAIADDGSTDDGSKHLSWLPEKSIPTYQGNNDTCVDLLLNGCSGFVANKTCNGELTSMYTKIFCRKSCSFC